METKNKNLERENGNEMIPFVKTWKQEQYFIWVVSISVFVSNAVSFPFLCYHYKKKKNIFLLPNHNVSINKVQVGSMKLRKKLNL